MADKIKYGKSIIEELDREEIEDGIPMEETAQTEEQAVTPENKTQKGNSETYVHKFQNPFKYEGKTYKTINFYFGSLTGEDIISVENEMHANNEYVYEPIFSGSYQSKIASKASGIGSDIIEAMPYRDFVKITHAAAVFIRESLAD